MVVGRRLIGSMAVPPTAAELPVGPAADGEQPSDPRRAAVVRHVLALSPFTLYLLVFLGLPAIAVVVGAFETATGGFTLSNLSIASGGVYRQGFETSVELALLVAVVPALAGALLAYALHVGRREGLLRRAVMTASGVFANFGGLPLAFLFIASFGTTGLATSWLEDVGINLYGIGFNLYSFSGVALVYMYFQVPLMVLIFLPALEGLRPSWREAASNLGASARQYWRYVAIPALLPTLLGCTLLLFGFGLSAYATADAMTSGSIALTPIQIGSFLNGNVLAGQENVGKALSLGMLVVLAAVMALYAFLQRRVSRWLR